MATTPTVLANTSTSPSAPVSPPSTGKLPIVPILLAVVAGIVIAGLGTGGVVYYFARSGRIPMERGAAQKIEADVPVSTHAMVLDPLLVNLADSGGSSYLRVSLTLRITDMSSKKDAKSKDEKTKDGKGSDEAVAAVRDTVLTVLGQQTADGLLAVDGKEHLKKDLKAALAEHNSDLKVLDVFFTDFLVQH